ncbi:MAG: O-antigen ligase family protein [Candidatus Brocadiales bacterium]|nr:O-antigen ligase family protein [Candidatus Brocadiales bacterium]
MLKTNKGQIDVRVVILFVFIFILTLVLGNFIIKTSANLVLAAVVGISLFILCFISVKYALYTLIFSMLLSPEFGTRTTEGGGMTIRLDDFLLIIIAFGWFARTAIYKELGLFRKTPMNRPILYYMLACGVSTALGMMFGNVQLFKGFFFLLKYLEYFIVYFMAINYLENRKQIRNMVIALIIVFVIICFASIAQIPQGERITAPFEGKGGEPNTLGGYLLLILSIVGGLLLNTDKNDSFKYKAALGFIAFLAIIPILFSQSRGTWTAVVPCYLTFLIISKKKALLGIMLVLALIIGPFVIPKTVKERFEYTFQKQKGWAAKYQEHIGHVALDTSTSERIISAKRAITAYAKHPLFGYGVTGWRFLDAQYLKTLVETGLLGITALGFLLYAVLRETRKVYKGTEDKFHKGVSMGFFAGTIAMMAHALGANTFIIVRIMEPFCFLMAIVVSIHQMQEAEKLQKGEMDKTKKDASPAFTSSPFILRR